MGFERDRYFLEVALKGAEKAYQEHTYPVGAIIVDQNNKIAGSGRNQVHPLKDATAHAEIAAIRNAGDKIMEAKILGKRLTLYSSLEPCPMCTGAILFGKIQRVVWVLNDGEGFGGFKKMRDSELFASKFQKIEVREEPFQDLKQLQLELMEKWSRHPNNARNLRERMV
jgi:tRNA(adenine34) deaminase